MKKIKIAQVGIGHDHAMKNGIWETVNALGDVFEVKGIHVPDSERRDFPKRFALLQDVRFLTEGEIFEDPDLDAVVIECEEKNLVHYALLAAKAGKAIHMDKPGGLSLSDFQALVREVKAKNLPFHLGYMYRYNPAVMELMAQIRRGELGEIFSVEAQMNCFHNREKRQWMANFSGGMMFYLGCHLVDMILQIQGRPQKVHPFNRCTGFEGVTGEDFGMALLEYPTGISLAKCADIETGGYARRQLVVVGSQKTVELKPWEYRTSPTVFYTDTTEYRSNSTMDRGETTTTQAYDRYETMMRTFARIAAGEQENPYSPDYELLLFETLLQCCGAGK